MSVAVLDLEDLRKTVADVFDVEVVTDDADFVEDLGVDSLMALEVMVVLEKKYNVKMTEADLRAVTNLKKAHALLADKLRAT